MSKIFVSLLLLQLIMVVYGGSCTYGSPQSPVNVLVAGATRATISGAGIQINPITNPDTGAYLENEYVRSEVSFMRELQLDSPDDECISALSQTTLEYPYVQSLNLSECECSHSVSFDFFPDGTTRRDFIRVNISCDDFATTRMLLDFSIVDGSYDVPTPTENDTSIFTYDKYRPNQIKFNVTVEDWPWSELPDTYGAIFLTTTVNVPEATLTTNTTTEELTAVIENDHVRFDEGIQRGFSFDGFSYVTPIESTSTAPFIVAPNFQLINGIGLCWLKKPIALRPRVVRYDPTLSTLFFGDPPTQDSPEKDTNKDSKLALKVALPVVLVTVAAVGIFAIIVYNTPSLKNFFRPFRDTNKDGALV